MLGEEAVRSHAQTPKDPAGPSNRRKAWRVALFIGSMLSTETMTRKLRADADDWCGSTAVAMIKLAAGCDARAFLTIVKNKCGDDGCKKQCEACIRASKLLLLCIHTHTDDGSTAQPFPRFRGGCDE